ncbi:hypothetical protein GCM10009106_19200 [Sphingomonas japonica]
MILKPFAHENDLVGLRCADAIRHGDHVGRIGPALHQRDHVDRLLVMLDHATHERDIVGGVAGIGDPARLSGAECATILPGGARLNDGHFLCRGSAGTDNPENADESAHLPAIS